MIYLITHQQVNNKCFIICALTLIPPLIIQVIQSHSNRVGSNHLQQQLLAAQCRPSFSCFLPEQPIDFFPLRHACQLALSPYLFYFSSLNQFLNDSLEVYSERQLYYERSMLQHEPTLSLWCCLCPFLKSQAESSILALSEAEPGEHWLSCLFQLAADEFKIEATSAKWLFEDFTLYTASQSLLSNYTNHSPCCYWLTNALQPLLLNPRNYQSDLLSSTLSSLLLLNSRGCSSTLATIVLGLFWDQLKMSSPYTSSTSLSYFMQNQKQSSSSLTLMVNLGYLIQLWIRLILCLTFRGFREISSYTWQLFSLHQHQSFLSAIDSQNLNQFQLIQSSSQKELASPKKHLLTDSLSRAQGISVKLLRLCMKIWVRISSQSWYLFKCYTIQEQFRS